MKIIIVGCGKVGYTLAETLCNESHDVTVIDNEEDRLIHLANRLDVDTVYGNGASYHVLQTAGIENCNVLIAATDQDEVNMLCCLIARKAAQCKTIARVRDPNYYAEIGFIQEELGLSLAINPDLSAAEICSELVQVPFAVDIDTFAKGKVKMITFVLPDNSPWADKTLADIARHNRVPCLVAIMERNHQAMIPNGTTVMRAGDRISVVLDIQYLKRLFSEIGFRYKPIRNVLIASGGNMSYYLAQRLCAAKLHVKIIESNRTRCEELVDLLPKATIICGKACNENVLLEEGVAQADAFCALMDNDSENITLALYANKVSQAKRITRINKMDLEGIVAEIPLGAVVSPKSLTAEHILRYVRAMGADTRTSRMESVNRLANDQVEALAFSVTSPSEVTDQKLMDLHLKSGVLFCSIIRDGKSIVPTGQDSIHVGDQVVLVTTRRYIDDLRDVLD